MLINENAHLQDVQKLTTWGNAHDNTVKFAVNTLIEYLNQVHIPLLMFTESDWGNFFESSVIATKNINPVKSKIKSFLAQNDYPNAVIQALQNNQRCGGTNYILTFDQLQHQINQKRLETYRSSLYQIDELDSYSSIEMGIYLIWLGLSLEETVELRCHDFDYSNGIISIGDRNIKISKNLIPIFYRYVNAEGYYYDNGKDDKSILRQYNHVEDIFLCKGNGGYKVASLRKKINELGFTEKLIWLSGRFNIAWQRHNHIGDTALSWDNIENIELFFEFGSSYHIQSKLQLSDLKYDWERYCNQKQNLFFKK